MRTALSSHHDERMIPILKQKLEECELRDPGGALSFPLPLLFPSLPSLTFPSHLFGKNRKPGDLSWGVFVPPPRKIAYHSAVSLS